MDSRLLWFAVGAGVAYLLCEKGGGGAGLGGGFSVSFGGNVGAAVPPDQRWQQPRSAERIGTWDPMGSATFFKDTDSDTGNKVNTGGGYNA